MVTGMANTEQDPAGSTHEFRAFANRGESASSSSGPNPGLIIGAGVVLVAVVVVIALLVI